MIHILTAHWQNDHWVDIQLEYFRRYVRQPYLVYAFLNGLPEHHRTKFYYTSTEEILSPPAKLNLLADLASFNAEDGRDWLLFIDGDAFPVADLVAFGEAKLKEYDLLAVQRSENSGEVQPHPAFCLTTVEFWKRIQGDWNEGEYFWRDERGNMVTDVGARLLVKLLRDGIDWYRLLRSNKRELHPLWFGLYDDVVYHHGAGFRRPVSRVDWRDYRFSRFLGKYFRRRMKRRIIERNEALSASIYQMVLDDSNFFEFFQGRNQSGPKPSSDSAELRNSRSRTSKPA